VQIYISKYYNFDAFALIRLCVIQKFYVHLQPKLEGMFFMYKQDYSCTKQRAIAQKINVPVAVLFSSFGAVQEWFNPLSAWYSDISPPPPPRNAFIINRLRALRWSINQQIAKYL